VNPLSAPFYLLPPLIVASASIVLIILVLLSARRAFAAWIFCALLLAVGLSGLLIFAMRSSPNIDEALPWDKAATILGLAIFVLYYHFTLIYTQTRRQQPTLFAAYIVLLVVAALGPTDLVIQRLQLESYGYAPVLGPVGFFVVINALILMVAGAYNLLRRYEVSLSYDERNRLLYLVIGTIFPMLGGVLDGLSNLPPAGIWGNLIFCIIYTVAIVKYHLLDIRIVFRKSLVYILVSSMIAVPYLGILYLLHFFFKPIQESWWIHVIIILLLAILLRPLYSRAQQFVDRLFYRDRYDYLKALDQFSQKTQSIVNLKELGSTLTGLVCGALRTSSAYLLLPSESDNGFVVVSSSGLGSPPSGVVLKNSSLLIKWLKLQRRIIFSEEFNIVPQLQSLSLGERNNLKQMEAKLCIPIQNGPGQLSGILVLGNKLSQQPYSSEDRQVLKTLSSQMAMALENARLYNESQQEVKERKQAEDSLKLQQAYFQQLFDNSPDAIVMLDNTDRVVQINDGFERLFGYNAEEIKDRFINELIIPEDYAEEAAALSRTAIDGKAARKETVRKCKDGSLTDVSALGYPIHFDNKTVGVYVIYSDITERKQAEEREKELQRELYLSSRLAAIGELAAGVAHQLNNPLTGILGFSQRLLRKSADEETSQDLRKIYGETERAAKIVQNLLAFARCRQPKKEYSDVNNVVQSALELRAYELKTSNIEVTTKLAPSLPKIMLDFHQMQEVFLNLILNAEQAMTEGNSGGKLTIKTEKNKGYVRCTFSDDGPGIPPENLDNVFDPFFTTKGERGGTGLGLSVCHGIIGEHGGKIYAKSKPRKGATFFVELPITTKE
jgi:PAS domain S-box-containing protein